MWIAHAEERGSASTGLETTQAGIANAARLSRGYVSRAVAPLIERGWVSRERRRVPGFNRSLVAYRLTSEGSKAIGEIRPALLETTVQVRRFGSEPTLLPLGEAMRQGPARPTLWEVMEQLESRGHVDIDAPTPRLASRATFLRVMDDAPWPDVFRGRDRELQALRDWLDHGRPAYALEGPAGVGKSTLVAWAVQTLHPRRHALWIRLFEGSSLHGLVDRLLEAAARFGRPGPAASTTGPEEFLDEMAERFRGLPLLLIVDDVHKADAHHRSLIVLLVHLAARLRTLRLILIGREVALSGDSLASTEWARLRPLDDEVAEQLLNDYGVPGQLHGRLARAAAGNPLFLRLLASHPSPENGSAEVGDYLTRSLASNLAPPHVAALHYVSALRAPVARSRFERLGIAPTEALDGLARLSLLTERTPGAYDMHDLVRDTFYAQLPPQDRERIHADWASVFRPEAGDWADVDEFLYHLGRAGRRDDAIRWLLRHRTAFMDWTRSYFGRHRSAANDSAHQGGEP